MGKLALRLRWAAIPTGHSRRRPVPLTPPLPYAPRNSETSAAIPGGP